MSPQMHLMSFMLHTPINHTLQSWADSADGRVAGLSEPAYWKNLARTLERGCFDGIFFADGPGVFDQYKNRTDEAIKYAVCWPAHDPMPLVALMGAETKHLGFAVTMSTALYHPFVAARLMATLDNLTQGRMGWNIVTGNQRSEHKALGIPALEHDQRYDRADEYMALCYALWNAIKPDAIIFDRENGIFADPAKVGMVNFSGKYFQCQSPPVWMPLPQGRPVLFQAGTSGRGMTFAVEHADIIFAIQPRLDGMKQFMQRLKTSSGAKRTRVSFGIQPIIGGTEAEARKRAQELEDRLPIEGALARLSGSLGVDFSTTDLDRPLEEIDTQSSKGLMAAMSAMHDGKRFTLREAATRWGLSTGMPRLIGSPEQVADQMVAMWRETGCYAFNVTPTITPSSVEEFVDQVVPILQKRGLLRKEYVSAKFNENLLSD